MAASKYNIKINQGATYRKTILWSTGTSQLLTPVDLTGCTARIDFRTKLADTETLLRLTTENGRITLGGTQGTIMLYLSATETAALNWELAVYDLEIQFTNGDVRRLLQGQVIVSPEVTRL